MKEIVTETAVQILPESFTDIYSVDTEIGRGKFAVVKRCRHNASGEVRAAKLVHKRRKGRDCRAAALREAEMLRVARAHPRVVNLIEVYETRNELVIVTEYARGGELFNYIAMEGQLEEGVTHRLMRQVLEGVMFLHQQSIIHMDIKPQNILLTDVLPHGDVILCDLGLARTFSNDEDILEIVGTPDYVAPEVLDYEPLSTACDIWSIGVLAYVMLTGCSPFAGDSNQETFLNISQVNLDFPQDLFASISSAAIDFMQQLLVRQPRKRPTANQCLEHPWLQTNQPEETKPDIENIEKLSQPSEEHLQSEVDLNKIGEPVVQLNRHNREMEIESVKMHSPDVKQVKVLESGIKPVEDLELEVKQLKESESEVEAAKVFELEVKPVKDLELNVKQLNDLQKNGNFHETNDINSLELEGKFLECLQATIPEDMINLEVNGDNNINCNNHSIVKNNSNSLHSPTPISTVNAISSFFVNGSMAIHVDEVISKGLTESCCGNDSFDEVFNDSSEIGSQALDNRKTPDSETKIEGFDYINQNMCSGSNNTDMWKHTPDNSDVISNYDGHRNISTDQFVQNTDNSVSSFSCTSTSSITCNTSFTSSVTTSATSSIANVNSSMSIQEMPNMCEKIHLTFLIGTNPILEEGSSEFEKESDRKSCAEKIKENAPIRLRTQRKRSDGLMSSKPSRMDPGFSSFGSPNYLKSCGYNDVRIGNDSALSSYESPCFPKSAGYNDVRKGYALSDNNRNNRKFNSTSDMHRYGHNRYYFGGESYSSVGNLSSTPKSVKNSQNWSKDSRIYQDSTSTNFSDKGESHARSENVRKISRDEDCVIVYFRKSSPSTVRYGSSVLLNSDITATETALIPSSTSTTSPVSDSNNLNTTATNLVGNGSFSFTFKIPDNGGCNNASSFNSSFTSSSPSVRVVKGENQIPSELDKLSTNNISSGHSLAANTPKNHSYTEQSSLNHTSTATFPSDTLSYSSPTSVNISRISAFLPNGIHANNTAKSSSINKIILQPRNSTTNEHSVFSETPKDRKFPNLKIQFLRDVESATDSEGYSSGSQLDETGCVGNPEEIRLSDNLDQARSSYELDKSGLPEEPAEINFSYKIDKSGLVTKLDKTSSTYELDKTSFKQSNVDSVSRCNGSIDPVPESSSIMV